MNSLDENVVETEIYSGSGEPGTQILSFDKLYSCRYLKIELTEAYATSYWSIYELNIGISNQVKYEYLTSDNWSAVTSNHGIALEKYAIDNSLNTVWKSGKNQEQGNTTYLLNLGAPQTICGIAITNGSEMWSYLEDYEVYAWCDGEEAKLVAKTEGKMSNTQLYFEPQMAKYLWIKAGTTSTANRQFAIADINVYTRSVDSEQ